MAFEGLGRRIAWCKEFTGASLKVSAVIRKNEFDLTGGSE